MKSGILRSVTFGIALAGVVSTAAAYAEDGAKALPTLLIKGEVVSVDASDPSAELLTVKDRYGFETPILLTPETKVSQGASSADATKLVAGTAVEVEYNFDVNTAKRHAVSVKLPTPSTSAEATPPAPVAATPAAPAEAAPVTTPAPEVAAPMTPVEPPSTPSAPTESTPAPSAPSDPSTPQAAPTTTQ